MWGKMRTRKRKPVKLVEGENGFMRVVPVKSPVQHEENKVQIPIMVLLRVLEEAGAPILPFHVPNGGKRSLTTAKKMKAAGVRKGIPDIPIAIEGGRVLWIELKFHGNYLEKDQKDIHAKLRALGHIVTTITAMDAHDAQDKIIAVMVGCGVLAEGSTRHSFRIISPMGDINV